MSSYRSSNSIMFPLQIPLAWRLVRALSQTSRVHAVVWTQSGDGLLTTGSEVIMWTQCENVWNPIWKSKPEQPHSLVSTKWYTEGLEATKPDGSTCTRGLVSMTLSSFIGSSKGKVAVYHWDDMTSLQEIELSHPQPVSMIQWRPSNFSFFQIQVLLTCSLDGAVRLWIEIDSGSVKLDKALGREIADKHRRPTFSVGATIEVNQCLNGMLGTNIYVIWACEIGAETKRDRARTETNSFNGVSKGNNIGKCE
jgi:WD40 repeat protein